MGRRRSKRVKGGNPFSQVNAALWLLSSERSFPGWTVRFPPPPRIPEVNAFFRIPPAQMLMDGNTGRVERTPATSVLSPRRPSR